MRKLTDSEIEEVNGIFEATAASFSRALPNDYEDLRQECWVRFLRAVDKQPDKPITKLARVLGTNCAIDYKREAKKQGLTQARGKNAKGQFSLYTNPPRRRDMSPGGDDDRVDEYVPECVDDLWLVDLALAGEARQLVLHRLVYGYTFPELAKMYNMSLGAVFNNYRRALESIREDYEIPD